MAKRSSNPGTGGSRGSSGRPAGGSGRPASGSSRGSSNSRMWSQPATARQLAALKANGSHDGKYYSKGRARQTISESVRGQGSTTVSPTVSAGGMFNPLDDAALDHLTCRQNPTSPTTAAPSPGAAHQAAEAAAAPDHIVVLEEGTTMSQSVPVRSTAPARSVAAVADLASSGTSATTPFGYVPELVDTLLKPLIATTDASHVRALEKALTIAKGTLVKELARARNTLVGILHEAPSGTFASPEASAEDILWNACSADVEQLLMSATQSRLGRTRPAKVVDELLAQVRHRVELALIEARDMVEIAQIQAALPPAPARGYEPCWGEVTGVKRFGAFVRLPSGESGLLHVSEMQPLNRGRRVEDPARLVNVGQQVYVRVTGKNEKGQLDLAMAEEVRP